MYKRGSGEREYTLAVLEGGTVFGEAVLASRRTRGAYDAEGAGIWIV